MSIYIRHSASFARDIWRFLIHTYTNHIYAKKLENLDAHLFNRIIPRKHDLILPDGDQTFETSGHIDHQMSSPVGRLATIVRLADSLIICCHFETIVTVFL